MGGLGRSINVSYAEYTRVPASNVVSIASELSWEELAAIPESYATAWTCLHRNLVLADGQVLVIRGATYALGQAALKIAVHAGARVIATTRNRERMSKLEVLGAQGVELEGPDLVRMHSQAVPKRLRCRVGSRRQQHHPGFFGRSSPRRKRLSRWLPGWTCSHLVLQPSASDAKRSAVQLLRQLYVRLARISSIGCPTAGYRRPRGLRTLQGKTGTRVSLRRNPGSSSRNGVESGRWEIGSEALNTVPSRLCKRTILTGPQAFFLIEMLGRSLLCPRTLTPRRKTTRAIRESRAKKLTRYYGLRLRLHTPDA